MEYDIKIREKKNLIKVTITKQRFPFIMCIGIIFLLNREKYEKEVN